MKRYLQLRERFTNRILHEENIDGLRDIEVAKIISLMLAIRCFPTPKFPEYICEEIIYD